MPTFNFSFLWIIASAGLLTFLAICLNFASEGWQVFPGDPRRYAPGGDPQRGRLVMMQYGCGSCHVIPGIFEAHGRVGPSLARFDQQIYIAGQWPNTAEHLERWTMDPRKLKPETLMPSLGVRDAEARDMAAYLYQEPRTLLERMVRGASNLWGERLP